MDPVHGKYINLLQADSDRKTWAEFIEKVEKLGHTKAKGAYQANNTGNPSAYFKAEVANSPKVKELRKKYNVTAFGIEGIDQSNIVGQIISGAKVFLKETKEIATIGQGHKNEYGYPVVKKDGSVVRREMHEFVVLHENSDIEGLEYNPYAVCTSKVGREDYDKYERCVNHVKDAQTESTKKLSLDESLDAFLKKKDNLEEHHLHTREDKIAYILDRTKTSPAGQYEPAKLMDMSDEQLDALYRSIENDEHLSESQSMDEPYDNYEAWCDDLTELGPGLKYVDYPEGMKAVLKGKEVGKWDETAQIGYIYENPEEVQDWFDKDGNLDDNGAYDAAGHYYADRDIKEASAPLDEKKKVYYFEYYPHYSAGNLKGQAVMTLGELNQLYTYAAKDMDDEFQTLHDAIQKRAKGTLYWLAQYDLLQIKNLIKKLLSKGTVGNMTEEGSHAFSIVSMDAAEKKVREIEAKVAMDNFEEGKQTSSASYDDAEAYVLYLLNNRYEELFDTLGLDMPQELYGEQFENAFEEAKNLGIEYYMHHPEEIDFAVLHEAIKPKSYKGKDIKFIPIKDSAFILGTAYDPEMETMYLKFKTGAYEYFDVPEEVYEALLKAPSMGQFFHKNIRNVYAYDKVKTYMTPGRKPITENSEYDAAAEYVDYLLGGNWEELFNKLGMQVPQDMDAQDFIPTMEKAQALGIEYFTNHPEEIEYEKIQMNEGSLNYSHWRKEAEDFVAQHAGELDRADEAKYDIGNLDYNECLNAVKELGDEDIDYLYKKLKQNGTMDLDNQMNEIFGFDKDPKKIKEEVPAISDDSTDADSDMDAEIATNVDSTKEMFGANKYNDDFSDANDDADEDNMDSEEPEEETSDIPEIIDFRNTEEGLTFTPETEEYQALDKIYSDPELWADYTEMMSAAGIEVTCDDLTDAFKVTWSDADTDAEDDSETDLDLDEPTDSDDDDAVPAEDDEESEEIKEYLNESKKVKARFAVEEGAKNTVKKIVEGKGYTFITLRGSLKESKQPDIYELIVEKNGNRTSIVYDDNTNLKPWKWNRGEFQHLQECLDAIYIPFKKLVNETAQTDIDKQVIADRVKNDKLNEWAYKTDALPEEEKKRREERGYDIYEKIIDKDLSKRGFNR